MLFSQPYIIFYNLSRMQKIVEKSHPNGDYNDDNFVYPQIRFVVKPNGHTKQTTV